MGERHRNGRRAVTCADCDRAASLAEQAITRRQVLAGAAGGIVAAGWVGAMGPGSLAAEAASALASARGETLVAQLYKSLTETQRAAICFGFDHELRSVVDANWHITETRVDTLFDKDQQDLVKQIFLSLHSERYRDQVMKQVEHDARDVGGFGSTSVAIFGEPGTGKFEYVQTGRHLTRRCDGDSVEGAAFGGPIFYGHAAEGFDEAPDHPGNVYWYQGKRANEVFAALDGKQREAALVSGDPRRERKSQTVAIRPAERRIGIAGADLSADQRTLVKAVLADVLMPFRAEDVAEVMKLVDEAGGVERLHMAFHQFGDIGEDGVWDIWQLEGPGMVWYFRGHPHVHTWVNVRKAV